jgi:hypothetical protein
LSADAPEVGNEFAQLGGFAGEDGFFEGGGGGAENLETGDGVAGGGGGAAIFRSAAALLQDGGDVFAKFARIDGLGVDGLDFERFVAFAEGGRKRAGDDGNGEVGEEAAEFGEGAFGVSVDQRDAAEMEFCGFFYEI